MCVCFRPIYWLLATVLPVQGETCTRVLHFSVYFCTSSIQLVPTGATQDRVNTGAFFVFLIECPTFLLRCMLSRSSLYREKGPATPFFPPSTIKSNVVYSRTFFLCGNAESFRRERTYRVTRVYHDKRSTDHVTRASPVVL